MYTYIPWELETEILSRVPATSLKQLRFTCKRWYALSKDPSFIMKNWGKAATQMVLKKRHSVFSVSIDFHWHDDTDDHYLKLTGKLEDPEDPKDVEISEIFQCEGLLLCTTEDKGLVVWNPCTGQTRWIQSSTMHHSCFLGYKNNSKYSLDSYKILSFSKSRRGWNAPVVDKFEMYEFDTGSWKVLDVDTHTLGVLSLGVSLKGDTYWLDSEDHERYPYLINSMVRFDFTLQRFGRLPIPFQSRNNYHEEVSVLSVVREEKLGVLHQRLSSLEMKIWVANNTITDEAEDDLSWSVFLVVDLGKHNMINNMTKVTSFLVDEENKRVMCCFLDGDMTTVYIVGEDIHIQVYREIYREVKQYRYFSLERSERPFLVSYVPSLV
ncbi:unnamed protein product [Microthlaspi erraticum]|uniref:F-box domain-containing protein n=1 Tax=Microthlaspi erraticum TaxID=1685480 RepID=A0A6D2KH80_9BRAS|nr:unnamed protein product [Microthlaspi erraticum]